MRQKIYSLKKLSKKIISEKKKIQENSAVSWSV